MNIVFTQIIFRLHTEWFNQNLPSRAFVLACVALSFQTLSFGQVDPAAQFKVKVIPPSPDAASLGKYGEHPVSLNNGLVNISIPLYEIKSGKLSLPISLSYHAGGVKAYDVASSVGLQWSLNAGGTISRTMRGQPDESGSGVLGRVLPDPNGPGEHFTCFLWGLTTLVSPFDGQADLFSYSLSGASGKFVFKNIKDTAVPWEIVTIPFSPVQIETTPIFDKFTVVDVDGTTYIFDQLERTTTVGQSSLVPTSWYLSSIISADKSDTITFTYTEPLPIQSVQGSNTISERVDITADAASRVEMSRSATVSTHWSINVKEITFNSGKVTFEYATDRLDGFSGRRLDAIRIFKENLDVYSEIKRFNLKQSYFTATGAQASQIDGFVSSNELTKRLRLDSLVEMGFQNGVGKTKPPYSFEYESGNFPVYGSTAQDFMGFYNGAHTNDNLLFYGLGENQNGVSILSQEFGANREVNPLFIKAGSIKKINYPTGGFSEFDLEPNQVTYTESVTTPINTSYSYTLTSRNMSVHEFPITVTSAMTGGNSSVKAKFNISVVNNIAGQLPITTGIGIYDQTTSTYAGMIVNPEVFNPQPEPALYSVLSTTPSVYLNAEVELLLNHSYRFYFDNNFQPTNNFFYSTLSWDVQTGSTTANVTTTKYAGGLRIKSITNNDGMGNTNKKKYAYTKWYYNSNLYTGDMNQMAQLFKGRSKRWFSYGSGGQGTYYWYNTFGENVTFQLGSSSGTVASYEEVEEYQVDAQDKPLGKTVDTFNKAIDAIPSLVPDFRSDEEWKRSQLANRKIYKSIDNGQFILLQHSVNQYNDLLIDAVKSYSAMLSEDYFLSGGQNMVLTECLAVASNIYRWMDFDQPIYKSDLISTTATQYDENGLNPVISTTQYIYGNPKHQQLTRTTQETNNGRTLTNDLRYPLDFSVANCNIDICAANLNDALATLKAQKVDCETAHYAAGEFTAYMGCQTTFHNQVIQTVMPAYNACKTNYSSCLNNAMSTANTKDKSILTMQRDNIVSQVIENTTGFLSDNTEFLTGGVRTDFKPTATGVTVPDVVWGLNVSSPVAKSDVNLNPSIYYRKVGSFTVYDEQNNVLQKSKENDILSSYVWDYNSEYPIAEVLNASSAEIAFTSFESDGNGNWSVPSSTRIQNESRTGTKSYGLGNGPVSRSGLINGKDYVVSFWAKSGSVSLNGSTISPASDEDLDGWQYYEASIAGSLTVSSLTISGAATIDELRFYPKGAQMTTYTYDPLVGLTSVTNLNNITSYYEYDSFGRLQMIKDSDKNIVKHYKYHYQNQE